MKHTRTAAMAAALLLPAIHAFAQGLPPGSEPPHYGSAAFPSSRHPSLIRAAPEQPVPAGAGPVLVRTVQQPPARLDARTGG